MIITEPSAMYLNPADYDSLDQFIERIGRICYKSENRITPDSAARFARQLTDSGHHAMLEHGYIFVRMKERFKHLLYVIERDKITHNYPAIKEIFNFLNFSGDMMSGNIRVMRTLAATLVEETRNWHADFDVAVTFAEDLHRMYPSFFDTPALDEKMAENLDRLYISDKSDCYDILSRTEFEDLCIAHKDNKTLSICLPHTILFTVNRGVTHEMVRHRVASFAQESTRYCNYSKGKFGSEITVVMPEWAETDPEKRDALYHIWKDGCKKAENAYMEMLAAGASPQEARAVLPISVKNDLVVTATEREWKHILNLRLFGTTGKPHPDMQYVMQIAGEELRYHSHNRLCKDYQRPEKKPVFYDEEPKGYYIFLEDEDGDLMPLTAVAGRILRFKDEKLAGDYLNTSLVYGFISRKHNAVILINHILDKMDDVTYIENSDPYMPIKPRKYN